MVRVRDVRVRVLTKQHTYFNVEHMHTKWTGKPVV